MEVDLSPCRIEEQDLSSMSSEQEKAIQKFQEWVVRHEGDEQPGLPHRGRNYGVLFMLKRLIDNYNSDIKSHKTEKGTQISGLTKNNISSLLEKFGETREPTEEVGRTSRGHLNAAEDLLEEFQEIGLGGISESARRDVLISMMRHCVWVEGQYHERARVNFDYNPSENASQAVTRILENSEGKKGPVAQHLVGAKLAVRYPNQDIPNHSAYTADDQTGRRGDFDIGDTVFHVTVTPKDRVYEKCKKDVEEGYRTYLMVPDDVRSGAEEISRQYSRSIEVKSIESFVGQNIDELSHFEKEKFEKRFKDLIETYNGRVSDVEIDNSILVDIPDNLG